VPSTLSFLANALGSDGGVSAGRESEKKKEKIEKWYVELHVVLSS
jgi:hypothetical protein